MPRTGRLETHPRYSRAVPEAENVEIVRRSVDAWNRGDLEAIVELGDPELEITLAGVFPDLARTYHGHRGFREFWRLFRGASSEISIETKELEAQGDSVFAGTVFHGTGREGVEVERPFYFAFHLRDGKVAAYETFSEREPARVAAGLPG